MPPPRPTPATGPPATSASNDPEQRIPPHRAQDRGPPAALPDLPIALLTSTQVADEPFVFEETAQGKALWKAQHAALFAGVSRGTHRYFASGHNIHRDDPVAVADAIRMVASEAEPTR